MTILDSNIWIAWLNESDSQHGEADQVLAEVTLPIGLPEYVLLEVATVLSRRVNKKTADGFIRYVQDNKDIQLIPSSGEFLQAVIKAYLKKPHRGLSFVDVSLTVFAKNYSVRTFDVRLKKALAAQV